MEHKLFRLPDVKFAASEDKTDLSFTGYGAVFDNIDAYGDVIEKGAFAKSLKSGDTPLMFLNHNLYSLPIGRWTKLSEDSVGLKAEGSFLDTADGRDTYTASKAGAITGLSIGFRPLEVELTNSKSADEPRRIIKSVDLLEISVVTFPANGKARIGDVKSFTTDDEYVRELIRLGMPLEEAKSFVEAIILKTNDKYQRAAEMTAANNLLSKLQGA